MLFVHGGPVPEGRVPTPRDSAVFTGYGALAASAGPAGITFDHRLHSPEHYPVSAEYTARAIERACGPDEVEADRVALWFFSGGGAHAADWLRAAPPWLRGIAWTYPVLAPPPDWTGDATRFDCVRAVTAAPLLPKLLVRVGAEYPALAATQDALVDAARAGGSVLEVLDIPDAVHG